MQETEQIKALFEALTSIRVTVEKVSTHVARLSPLDEMHRAVLYDAAESLQNVVMMLTDDLEA
jgi:hypothetical protein